MKVSIVILSLILIAVAGNGQTITGILTTQDGHRWPFTPGYEAQQKFDTVKIRMLFDIGGAVPAQINGYIVRQWYTYYPGVDPGGCADCPKPLPSRWFDTNDLLEKNKFNSVDKRKVWQYKYFNWD